MNVCKRAQTRITPKLSRLVWVLLVHSPLPSPGEGSSVGILGDPAKSPGSCSPKKGLVTHQALRPAAGEPVLPIFSDQSSWESCKAWSSQLHHTCPSCSRSSTRGHLACRPGSQRRRKLMRPETLGPPGPAESDGALGGLSQGTEQTRTPLQGSAACSSPAKPSLPQRRRTFASSRQLRSHPIFKSGDQHPTEQKCFFFSEVLLF